MIRLKILKTQHFRAWIMSTRYVTMMTYGIIKLLFLSKSLMTPPLATPLCRNFFWGWPWNAFGNKNNKCGPGIKCSVFTMPKILSFLTNHTQNLIWPTLALVFLHYMQYLPLEIRDQFRSSIWTLHDIIFIGSHIIYKHANCGFRVIGSIWDIFATLI